MLKRISIVFAFILSMAGQAFAGVNFPPPTVANVPGVAAAANNGYIKILTDAVRAAYTPTSGEIIYASDTHAFYVGDGSTAGGVASDCGFSAQQLQRMGFITPRHRKYLPALRYAISSASTGNIPGSVAVGNSIVQGSGASTGANAWLPQLGVKLQAYSSLGTSGNWTPTTFGIGGSTIASAVTFVSDYQDPAAYTIPKRSTTWTTARSVVYVMDMRNDPTYESVADYALLLRATLLQIKRHGADPVLVTEPPSINVSTGAIVDTSVNWTPYLTAAQQICADEGVTLVDCWSYFNYLSQQGIDLRPLMSDTVHPNDTAHALIASLVFRCMTTPSPAPGIGFTDRAATESRVAAYTSYASTQRTVSTVGTTDGNGTTAATTAGTARNQQMGSNQVYVVPTSGTLAFLSPGPIRGVIVSYYTDTNNTGRPTLTYNSVSPSGAVTTGARWDGFQSNGSSTLQNISGSFSRQFDWYYSTVGQNSTFVDGQSGSLTITANGGQIAVLGVTWIMGEITAAHSVWAAKTETGTWSAATFTDTSEPARTSTTAGDIVVLLWWGSALSIDFQTSPSSGKLDVTTDGNATAAQDMYSAGTGRNRSFQVAKGLVDGPHSTTLAIDAVKNASSSGFSLIYGHCFATTGTPDSSYDYLDIGSGETVTLGTTWKNAFVDTVISGTPAVRYNPGSATIALTTGSAVVRLQR
jgi:hypothetical protein